MPYVPSEKTNPPAEDRKIIDPAVERLAKVIATNINRNGDVKKLYLESILRVAVWVDGLESGQAVKAVVETPELGLAKAICKAATRWNYEGASRGEFNYAITRLIQRIPQLVVKNKKWQEKDELRYWLYADMVYALIEAAYTALRQELSTAGVLVDIKDEYKRRVITAYEAEQILKSGDCYNTPYYTRLVRVVDEGGKLIGHMEVMLKRDASTLHKDLLDGEIVLKTRQ